MEFVISLRAFNNVGDGQPVYQQVRTQPEEEVVAPTLDPAVGVKAVVLTPFTVVLQWADTMLSQNQYNSCTTFSSSSSSRYVNATDVTCLIDSLKPSTVCVCCEDHQGETTVLEAFVLLSVNIHSVLQHFSRKSCTAESLL
ncbi:neogenin-like [Eriocheir sinensis]|uniref:neogenin-like n=1 Tax=Eriocheir sinensis TaxID=95602 RepID=UPI0021C7BD11|nr:neogenin-like [Eriocheir sinensis]